MTQIDFLRKEIIKTGYPLEIEISSMLDNKWQCVGNTDSYFDREEGKLRDIDIIASSFYESPQIAPISLRTSLAIECKKTEDFAWVFFTRPSDFEDADIEGQYLDKIQAYTKNYENCQLMDIILGKSPLHYKEAKRIAVAYAEFCVGNGKNQKKSQKNKKVIFEAQNQIKKYIDSNFEQIAKFGFYRPLNLIDVIFPCIIFDGPLYEAIVENAQLQLNETNHLVLTTCYRSPFAVFERNLLIDIVQRKYFEDYSKIILKDRKVIEQAVRKNSKVINRKISEIIDLLGASRMEKSN